jgi:hypothetical protein
MTAISFQPIPILIDGHDAQGQLVLVDGQLVAVLARLDAEFHEPSNRGWWNLEAGFGPCCFSPGARSRDDLFESLAEAEAWVQDRLRNKPLSIPAA